MIWKRKWSGFLLLLSAILFFMSFSATNQAVHAQGESRRPQWAEQTFNTRQINVKVSQDPLKIFFGQDEIPTLNGVDKSIWKKVEFPKGKGLKNKTTDNSGWYNLTIPENMEVEEFLTTLMAEPQVLYAEPDPLRYLLEVVPDPHLNRQ